MSGLSEISHEFGDRFVGFEYVGVDNERVPRNTGDRGEGADRIGEMLDHSADNNYIEQAQRLRHIVDVAIDRARR